MRHRIFITLTSVTTCFLSMVRPAMAECPQPNELVTLTEGAVIEGRFADVEPLLNQTELAFGCSAPAHPNTLARMWGAAGVWLSLTQDDAGATDAFAAAWRVDPDLSLIHI